MESPGPDDAVLRSACARVGLEVEGAVILHRHATRVYLLPGDQIVVRITRVALDGAATSVADPVALTRWLVGLDFPATEPAPVDQPVVIDQEAVTWWRYHRQPDGDAPGAAALGVLLRQLHQLPEPTVALPDYVPLVSLGRSVDQALARTESDQDALTHSDLNWLADQRSRLIEDYQQLDSELGVGFIHGDAYPGNTLWSGTDRRHVLLGDWDEAARGPRELDLVNTHHGARTGRTEAERDAFNHAYGWDVTRWPGFPLLRAIRDLHTLAAYLRRALNGDRVAEAELAHRVHTLRTNDLTARWNVA